MQFVQTQEVDEWPTHGTKLDPFAFEALLLATAPTSSTQTFGIIL